MIQKEQANEVKNTLDMELKKVEIIQDKSLIERCYAFLEEYDEEQRLAQARKDKALLKVETDAKVLKLYEDFAECIKPLQMLNSALMESGDDLLQITLIQLSEIEDYINKRIGV